MITDKAKFIGILQLESSNLDDYFDNFIAQKEPELLKQWFGYALAKDIEATTPSAEAQALIDGFEYTDSSGYLQKITGLDDILPYFIYFYVARDKQSTDTNVGSVSALAENSERINPINKMVQNYSIGVVFLNEMLCYISDNLDTYTTIESIRYLDTINSLGI